VGAARDSIPVLGRGRGAGSGQWPWPVLKGPVRKSPSWSGEACGGAGCVQPQSPLVLSAGLQPFHGTKEGEK